MNLALANPRKGIYNLPNALPTLRNTIFNLPKATFNLRKALRNLPPSLEPRAASIGNPHADYEGLLDEVATRKIPVSQKWVKVHDRRERSWADRTKHWLYTNAQLQKLQNLTFFCCTYTRG